MHNALENYLKKNIPMYFFKNHKYKHLVYIINRIFFDLSTYQYLNNIKDVVTTEYILEIGI